ncbi:MAG: YhdH/YhfP family quinone oxidoreductase [Thermodesulfobacteriota bacterium]
METKRFKAMVVTEGPSNSFIRRITRRSTEDLPPGDAVIEVIYSSLNYKDALSASGNRGVTRAYPHTPGIDAAGILVEGEGSDFTIGDEVLVTGYDLGMNTSGGFGQMIRIPHEWVVRLPEGISLKESMMFGTAGFTAGLSVEKLVGHGISPADGEILVTGASGGVGSLAVSILSKIGYHVSAVTGKADDAGFLIRCGAKEIIPRERFRDNSPKPLLKGRFIGVVETVGGDFLATALKSTGYHGAVTCCGNVASPELHTTVFPFILRGVTLYGIDSANCPMSKRKQIWKNLAGKWKPDCLESLADEVPLEDLDSRIGLMLEGKLKGRTIVSLR